MLEHTALAQGFVRFYRVEIAHDTPGLADGVTIFTLRPGEALLFAWPGVSELWDDDAMLDVGPFNGDGEGLWDSGYNGSPFSVSTPDQITDRTTQPGVKGLGEPTRYGPEYGLVGCVALEDPVDIKLVVSASGKPGDPAPDATQGKLTLVFGVTRPVAIDIEEG